MHANKQRELSSRNVHNMFLHFQKSTLLFFLLVSVVIYKSPAHALKLTHCDWQLTFEGGHGKTI